MKYFALIILLLVSLQTLAQPTLTGATNNPVPGDVFVERWCDTNGISKGPAGAAVTWNFGSLNTNFMDTNSYVNCAGTPYVDSFPGCTITATNTGSYDYYTTDASKFEIVGSFYGGLLYYTKPGVIISYPYTYNTNRTDTSVCHYGIGSMHGRTTEIVSAVGDAYGTLILPSGTYTNTLRVHKIIQSADSSSSGIFNSRYEEYQWYYPGFHQRLLIMRFDTAFGGGQYLYFVVYNKQIATGITEINIHQNINLSVYPNPTIDAWKVAFTTQKPTNFTVKLMDITGRVLQTQSNNEMIDATGLAKGIYTIEITSDELHERIKAVKD